MEWGAGKDCVQVYGVGFGNHRPSNGQGLVKGFGALQLTEVGIESLTEGRVIEFDA